MKKKKNRGFFITCEGGEGSGKTTLITRLYDHFLSQGYKVFKTKEPGATQLGETIRELLLYKTKYYPTKRAELLLYLADRAQHVEEQLLPALSQGELVLCDRFTDSTLAYQGAARRFLDFATLRTFCAFASGDLTPDLTLFLDIDPQIGFARTKQKRRLDRLENEELSFHVRVREAFLLFSQKEPDRFYVIDGSQQPNIVFTLAAKKIDALLC